MKRAAEEEYLWDRSGPVDDQVVELERLLGRFATGRDGGRAGVRAIGASRGRRRWLAAAALVIAAGLWAFFASLQAPVVADAVDIVVVGPEPARLEPGDWLAEQGRDIVVTVGEVGEVTVAPGARLRVEEARQERTTLFLERGRIEVLVSPEAGARFFCVRTPVTLCVDLGCRYVLDVDDETGETHVRVELGQVAFESDGRAVLVPRGAEARAWPGGRLGTPRFDGLPFDLRDLLEIYDRADLGSDERFAAAKKTAAIASMPRDTLPLWHMLSDPDPRIVSSAEAALVRIAGPPDSAVQRKQFDRIDAAVWRAHLEDLWW